MSTPDQLLDGLMDALAALDDGGVFRFQAVYDPAPLAWSDPVARLFAVIARACEGEWHRRRTGTPYRLDEVAEAVALLSDADLAEGLETYALIAADGAGVLSEATLAAHAVVAQMLTVEQLDRQRTDRQMRRAISDNVAAWWGSADDAPEQQP